MLANNKKVVHCLNCQRQVGEYSSKHMAVKLIGCITKRIACTEFHITCTGGRYNKNHGHRYRYWTGIFKGRHDVCCRKVYFNSRGKEMSSPCLDIDPTILFKIDQGDVPAVSVFVVYFCFVLEGIREEREY